MTSAVGDDEFLSAYEMSPPSAQLQVDLFDGQWTSGLPLADVRSGPRPDLFDDPRIHWGLATLGGCAGQRVYDLGPLEGGHTWMLEQAGAAEVVGIEAHRRAFLRCLVVKNLLGMRARFELGDFTAYLRTHDTEVDLVVASGVLYHQVDPLELLALCAQRSKRLLLWTHYWDAEVLERRPDVAAYFTAEVPTERDGFTATLHRYEYGAGVEEASFCGGSRPHTHWMERAELLAALEHVGFTHVTVGEDDPDAPHGPALTLVAERPDAVAQREAATLTATSPTGPRSLLRRIAGRLRS